VNIGIAFGGGGTRGFSHLGALKAFEEAGIRPSIVSGTSAGSIVGVFVASGMRADDIMELVSKSKFIDYASVTLLTTGLFSLSNLGKLLERMLPAKEFKDLKIPFYATATNLYSGKVEYLHDGPLVSAVEASCAIPIIFAPVMRSDQLYVDGGVLDSLPVMPLIGKCDKIIAVSAGTKDEIKKVGSLKDAGLRAFDLISYKEMNFAREHADLLLEPEGLGAYRTLDTRHSEEIYTLGYECAKKADLGGFLSEPKPKERFHFFKRH
jgi:NTE family protein